MTSADEGVAPVGTERRGEPVDDIGARMARLVHQHFRLVTLGRRAPRHEIDHAADRRHAVERGRHALDDFHLPEIHRWNLQQPDRPGLTAVQRQAVGKDLRIPAAQALNADVRAAERG